MIVTCIFVQTGPKSTSLARKETQVRQRTSFAREMHAGEEDQVDHLLRLAFSSNAETTLVRKLRKSRMIAGETVLPLGEDIIGYYALSKMVKPKSWLCLAPVAIHPDHQRQKHGKRMVGMLGEWARLTQTPVVVLGQPAFYAKTGFSAADAAQLQSPYPIANTLVAGLAKPARAQDLIYPQPFDGA